MDQEESAFSPFSATGAAVTSEDSWAQHDQKSEPTHEEHHCGHTGGPGTEEQLGDSWAASGHDSLRMKQEDGPIL